MQELLQIETYNDGVNKVTVSLRDINIRVHPQEEEPHIMIICEQKGEGPLFGNKGIQPGPLTIYAVNSVRVPVFKIENGQPVPIMVVPTPDLQPSDSDYQAPYQQTIGEFDMWKILVFENHLISLNDAITKGILRAKGMLENEPLAFIMPG